MARITSAPESRIDPETASPQGSPEERAVALDYAEHERTYDLFVWLMTRFGTAWLALIIALILLYTY